MNKEDFTFELANFFIKILKEKGREVKFSDLEGWAKDEMINRMPEDDERFFWQYTNPAKRILEDLELVNSDDKMIVISTEARLLSEPISVRVILDQKKKKELFEDKIKVWKFYITIAGFLFAVIGPILNFLFKHNSVGDVIGWLFVGIALGYFLNEFLNKRIWRQ